MTPLHTEPVPVDEAGVQSAFDRWLPAESLSEEALARLTVQVTNDAQSVFAQANAVRPDWLVTIGSRFGTLFTPRRLAMVGAALVMVVLAAAGFEGWREWQARPGAIVEVSGGDMVVLRSGIRTYEVYPAGSHAVARQGDQIVTTTGSASIALFPSQVAMLSPGSHVQIEDLTESGSATHVLLRVFKGQTRHDVSAKLDPEDAYQVATVALTATVGGTDFIVAQTEQGETMLATLKGTVSAATDSTVVEVGAGTQLSMMPGREPAVSTFEGTPDFAGGQFLLYVPQNGEALRLYPSPAEEGDPIGELQPGETYSVLSQSGSDWLQLCCVNGAVGWVHKGGGPVVTTEPTPEPTVTPTQTPAPTATPIEEPTRTPDMFGFLGISETTPSTAEPELPPLIIPAPSLPIPSVASPAPTAPRAAQTTIEAPSPVPSLAPTPAPTPAPPPAEEKDDEDKPRPTARPTRVPVPTATAAPTSAPSPSDTPAPAATATPVSTVTGTVEPSETPRPTNTSTPKPPPTDTPTSEPRPTDTPTPKPPPTDTPTPEPRPTDTPTPEPRPTDTPTPEPPPTDTPTPEPPATDTATPEPPPTDTPTAEPPPTETPKPDEATPTPTEKCDDHDCGGGNDGTTVGNPP